jgi:recombinational DNA repair protein RecT
MRNQLAIAEPLRVALQAAASRYRHVIPASRDLSWQSEKEHVIALLARTPGLRKATPESIARATLQAGSMGLSLNPTLNHCYLIPRRARKRRQGETDADYSKVPTVAYASPSYRGLVHIAIASGAVAWVVAEIVHEPDLFRHLGPFAKPLHEPNVRVPRTIDNAIGAYCTAKTTVDDHLTTWTDRETIEQIRRMSEWPDSVMYTTLWTEGWRKIAIRRASKLWPLTMALGRAAEIMDEHDGIKLSRQEDPPREAHVCLNDDQVLTLHAAITDRGGDAAYADRQLTRLARRFGASKIHDISVDRFDEAHQFLIQFMSQRGNDNA